MVCPPSHLCMTNSGLEKLARLRQRLSPCQSPCQKPQRRRTGQSTMMDSKLLVVHGAAVAEAAAVTEGGSEADIVGNAVDIVEAIEEAAVIAVAVTAVDIEVGQTVIGVVATGNTEVVVVDEDEVRQVPV